EVRTGDPLHDVRFHPLPVIGHRRGHHRRLQRRHGDVALTDGGLSERGVVGKLTEGATRHGQTEVVFLTHAEGVGGGTHGVGADVDGQLHEGGVARQGERRLQGDVAAPGARLATVVGQRRRGARQGDLRGAGERAAGGVVVGQAGGGGDDLEDGARRQRVLRRVVDQRVARPGGHVRPGRGGGGRVDDAVRVIARG